MCSEAWIKYPTLKNTFKQAGNKDCVQLLQRKGMLFLLDCGLFYVAVDVLCYGIVCNVIGRHVGSNFHGIFLSVQSRGLHKVMNMR